MEPFAGAQARINRAHDQIEALRDEFHEFSAREPHLVREILDPDTGRKRAEYVVTEGFPSAWPTIVGEIAYDLRSALDHVVYDLTVLESGGPLGHTGFPILEEEARYDELTTRGEPVFGSGAFKTRGVNPYAKAAIRSLQPFEVRKAVPFEAPTLSLLQELSMVDRQRTIPLCRLRWPGSRMRSRRPVRDLRFLWAATLENGATLAEWTPTVVDGGQDIDVALDFDVGFDGWPSAKSQPVIEVLEGMAVAVEETATILAATVRLIAEVAL